MEKNYGNLLRKFVMEFYWKSYHYIGFIEEKLYHETTLNDDDSNFIYGKIWKLKLLNKIIKL